jgi:hypothetical protein
MALDPKVITQAKKDLEEINKIYQKIGENPLTINIDKATIEDISKIKNTLKEARTFVIDIEDGFGGMVTSIKNIVAEWDKGFNRPTKEATSSFSKLKGIAEKLSDDFKGIAELRGKEVKNLEKSTRLEVERLKRLTAELNARKDLSDVEITLRNNLNSEYKIQNDILKGAKERLEYEEKIEKTLGYTGALFGGIQKTLEHIGIESEAFEHLNEDLRDAAKSGNSLNVIGTGLKSIGHGIKESFKDPLVQVALIAEAFHELYKIGTDFNKKTFDIQKTLGLSWEASSGITHELEHMVVNSGKVADNTLRSFVNFEDLVKSTKELNEYYGTAVTFNSEQLAIQAKLQEVAGLTTEEASKLNEYEALTGKTAEGVYDSIGKINKGVFNQKKITQEVLKTGGQLAAQYKNNPELIAKAVVQAQRLGMTLEQTKNISANLLNFEDSISAELEAELLTGQDLNLERARGLALQGDTAGAAAELMKNLGPNGLQKFQKMNVIQQQSYAKALGMSADELNNSLIRQQKISKIENEQGKGLSEEIKKLKDKGEIEKAAALEERVLRGESVSLASQQLDNEAEIAKNIEKGKSALEATVAGPLGAIMKAVAKVSDVLAANKWIANVLGVAGAVLSLAAVAAGVVLVGKTLMGAFKSPLGSKSNPSHVIIEGGGGGSGGGRTRGGKGRKGRKGRGGKFAAAASILGETGISDMVGDEDGVLDSILEGAEDTSSGGSTPASKRASIPRDPKTGRFMKAGGKTKGLKSLFKGKNLLKGLKGLKGLAGGAGGLIASLGVDYAAEQAKKSGNKNLGKGLDIAGGALTGASTGAMIGSIIPGVGTLIGGAVGGLIGGGMSYFGGDEPEMAIGGIVNRPTRAIVGEAGAEAVIPLKQFYEKLDQLIHAVKSGGNIYLDSTKVGTAMNVGTYKLQ